MLDTSGRLQSRYALQTVFLQCMEEQRLDALVSPMSTVPPRKLTSPREPNVNGRSPIGWSLIGQQGFPAITVPAGFTTQIWDRVNDTSGGTRFSRPHQGRLAGRRRFHSTSRLTKQCYFASPRHSKLQPGIAGRRPSSDRCLTNRSFPTGRRPLAVCNRGSITRWLAFMPTSRHSRCALPKLPKPRTVT